MKPTQICEELMALASSGPVVVRPSTLLQLRSRLAAQPGAVLLPEIDKAIEEVRALVRATMGVTRGQFNPSSLTSQEEVFSSLLALDVAARPFLEPAKVGAA